MTLVKKWRKDWQGGLVTGGASTAYTLSTNETITLADGPSPCRLAAAAEHNLRCDAQGT
jgi:hypothetical protein